MSQIIKVNKEAVKRETPGRQRTEKATGREIMITATTLSINEVYEKLETPDGKIKTFRIAKARYLSTKDFKKIKEIKDELCIR